MTWTEIERWPTDEDDVHFRSEAVHIEREFFCRKLSWKERWLITRHKPKSSQVATRFCLTTRELYAELKSGEYVMMNRNHISTLEIRGAYLAIGNSDSVVFFAPNYGNPDQEALMSLASTRPRMISPINLGFFPWIMLPFAALLTVLIRDCVRAARSFHSGYSDFDGGASMDFFGYLFVLLLSIAAAVGFLAKRQFIDTRGLVDDGLLRAKHRPILGRLTDHKLGTPAFPFRTVTRTWFSSLVTLLVAVVVVEMWFINLVGIGICASLLAGHSISVGDSELAILILPSVIIVLFFWRPPRHLLLSKDQVELSGALALEKRTFNMKKPGGHFIAILLGRPCLILEHSNHLGPTLIVLSRLRPEQADRQGLAGGEILAESFSSLWQIPIIEVSKS